MNQLLPGESVTYAEKYDPAMSITEQAEADAYFERCVLHHMSFGIERADAERFERGNLAYWAGYYDNETRARVERLFHCEHPIFGSIEKNGPPTAATAFRMGLDRSMLKRGE